MVRYSAGQQGWVASGRARKPIGHRHMRRSASHAGPGRPQTVQSRSPSVLTPGPESSVSALLRPAAASSSEMAGPSMTGPLPTERSASVAVSVRPSSHALPPDMRSRVKYWTAGPMCAVEYSCTIPNGRRMSSPWTKASTMRVIFGAGGVAVRAAPTETRPACSSGWPRVRR